MAAIDQIGKTVPNVILDNVILNRQQKIWRGTFSDMFLFFKIQLGHPWFATVSGSLRRNDDFETKSRRGTVVFGSRRGALMAPRIQPKSETKTLTEK